MIFWQPFVKWFALCYRTVVLSVLSVTLVYCGQTVGWIRMPLGMEVGLGPGDIVLDEDPATTQKWAQKSRPLFGPCLLWPSGRPSQQLLSSCYNFLAKAQFISTYFLQICTISCRWFLCFTLFQYRNFWCCRTMLLCLALDSTMVCCSIMSLL